MILVGGDSFTDKNWQGTTKWIHRIEKDPNKIINTAVSGASNQWILYQILDTLHKRNDISHAILALSNWSRYPSPWADTINLSAIEYNGGHWSDRGLQLNKIYPTRPRDITRRVNEILMLIYTVMGLCVNRNIKFTCFQMLDYTSIKYRHRYIKAFAKSDYVDLISKLQKESSNTDLIDWPNWPAVPGLATLCRIEYGKEVFEIGKDDTHPSDAGHMLLSGFIQERSKFL